MKLFWYLIFVDLCRRDSFITHRAFCDALAEESARNHRPPNPINGNNNNNNKMELDSKASIAIESPPPPPPPPPKKSSPPRTLPLQPPLLTQSTSMVSSILPIQSSGIYINDHSFYNLAYGV